MRSTVVNPSVARRRTVDASRCLGRAAAILCALGMVACAGASGRTTPPTATDSGSEVELGGMRIVGGAEGEAYTARDLFERARAATRAEDHAGAIALYAQLVAEFPNSPLAASSLYNAALSELQADGGEPDDRRVESAILLYERLERDYAGSNDVTDARFQLARLYARTERWSRLVRVADILLRGEGLSVDDRVEAMARRAQGLFGAGEIDDARSQGAEVLSYVRSRPSDAPVRAIGFVAAANYVVAEAARLHFEAFEIPEGDVATQRAALDRASERLIAAQAAYVDTMRWADPYWSSAAGYRVGSMYDRFFLAILEAPVPPSAEARTEAERREYETAYRQELARFIEPILRHGVTFWELTLQMIERTGVASDWAPRIEQDLARVRATLATLVGAPD